MAASSIVGEWSIVETKLGTYLELKNMRERFADLLNERLYEAKQFGSLKALDDYQWFQDWATEIAEHIYRLDRNLHLKRTGDNLWTLKVPYLRHNFPHRIITDVLRRKTWLHPGWTTASRMESIRHKPLSEEYVIVSAYELADAVSRQYADIQKQIANGERVVPAAVDLMDLKRREKTRLCPCTSPCTDQKYDSWCFVKDNCEHAERSGLTALVRGPWKYCNPQTDQPRIAGHSFFRVRTGVFWRPRFPR